jgi:hypothetical protein
MNTLNGNFIERTIPDLKDATLDLLIGGVPSTMNTADFGAAIATPPELVGINYVYVSGNGTDAENGEELKAAYATAQTMSPSATNTVSVIVGPGKYFNSTIAELPLADGQFEFSTDYINVISLTGNPDVFLSGISVGGICYIKGMNTSEAVSLGGVQAGFNLINSPSNQKLENCVGGNYSFGWGGTISGTFINCVGGNNSFATITTSSAPIGITEIAPFFIGVVAAGTFINCTAGNLSFGVGTMDGTCSGVFTNCVAGNESFGLSIGSLGGNANGTFTNCKSGTDSFAGIFGLSGGVFNNCVSIGNSFGAFAQGTYTNCVSGINSFGRVEAGGTFNSCISGSGSFGGITGALTGRLYYCRLTSGTFPVVSSGGKTVYCIDGNNDPNNQ